MMETAGIQISQVETSKNTDSFNKAWKLLISLTSPQLKFAFFQP